MEKPSAKNNTLSLEYWENRWEEGQITFHEKEGSQILHKHFSAVVKETFPHKEPADLKIFVPLCGKSKDMNIFYQLGFTVVGIEYSALAIQEFFQENSIPVDKTDGPFTKSADGRIILGEGDLFSFKGGANALPFAEYDIVWDRGSFEAINDEDRERYATFTTGLLSNAGLYLICVSEYDLQEYGGPPLAVTRDDLKQYFGGEMSIELIDSDDRMDVNSPVRQKWVDRGLTKMTGMLYKMSMKCD